MSNGYVVLITKDKPSTLVKTLDHLENSVIPIVIIDDSTSDETYKIICNNMKGRNITYHGRNEQDALLMKFKDFELKNFIRPLGSKDWNLGFVRNYAIIVSKSLGCTKVLFMDDDIIVRHPEHIEQSLLRVNSFNFMGAKITGMADDSVIGHLMRACGGEFFEFLSGGFLAFDINVVSEYFLNYYNEDQIWLFLHTPKAKFETHCEVEQQQYDPFESATTRALNQEFGEIIEEGVEEASMRSDHDLLLREKFWKEICEARLNYINQLPKLIAGTRLEHIGLNVYRQLREYHSHLSSNLFVDVFLRYFNRRQRWRAALESI